jgi:hypothetical protein
METLRRLFAKLKLRIESKSAVGPPCDRKFLGYSFWVANGREVKRRVTSNALGAMKQRTAEIHPRASEAPRARDAFRSIVRLARAA